MQVNKTTLFFIAAALSTFFYGLLILRFEKLSPRGRALVAVLGFAFSMAVGGIGLFYPR